jgi:hypothetical protein
MSMQRFTDWLYASSLSQAIQNTEWMIPAIQSIHIIALSALLASAMMVHLGAVGVIGRGEATIGGLCRRYMPWIWAALAVLAMTGGLLIVSEPERALGNSVFWIKMALLVVAVAFTVILARRGGSPAGAEEAVGDSPAGFKFAAALGLCLWVGVIVCGRWIAYALS